MLIKLFKISLYIDLKKEDIRTGNHLIRYCLEGLRSCISHDAPRDNFTRGVCFVVTLTRFLVLTDTRVLMQHKAKQNKTLPLYSSKPLLIIKRWWEAFLMV